MRLRIGDKVTLTYRRQPRRGEVVGFGFTRYPHIHAVVELDWPASRSPSYSGEITQVMVPRDWPKDAE